MKLTNSICAKIAADLEDNLVVTDIADIVTMRKLMLFCIPSFQITKQNAFQLR